MHHSLHASFTHSMHHSLHASFTPCIIHSMHHSLHASLTPCIQQPSRAANLLHFLGSSPQGPPHPWRQDWIYCISTETWDRTSTLRALMCLLAYVSNLRVRKYSYLLCVVINRLYLKLSVMWLILCCALEAPYNVAWYQMAAANFTQECWAASTKPVAVEPVLTGFSQSASPPRVAIDSTFWSEQRWLEQQSSVVVNKLWLTPSLSVSDLHNDSNTPVTTTCSGSACTRKSETTFTLADAGNSTLRVSSNVMYCDDLVCAACDETADWLVLLLAAACSRALANFTLHALCLVCGVTMRSRHGFFVR